MRKTNNEKVNKLVTNCEKGCKGKNSILGRGIVDRICFNFSGQENPILESNF
jgi:hypothetical protein